MKEVKAIVAKNLSTLRKGKGITQAELAEQFNYSDKAVSRWEHGDTLPDINVLYELCTFYGITMNDLVSEECSVIKDELHEKNAKRYRLWLGILAAMVVWLGATILFTYSQMIERRGYWIAFIWAIPLSCLVLQYFCRNIFNWITKFVFTSICIWSVVAAIYFHMLVAYNANLWMVYLIGIPMEALAFMWRKMKNYKNQ
ncbi:MAG: helix-turn-helix transcriptional regulator [Clostridia bacterium]|nr:helix-turn-helix transcriptional regulator [Clostridia bacterium]